MKKEEIKDYIDATPLPVAPSIKTVQEKAVTPATPEVTDSEKNGTRGVVPSTKYTPITTNTAALPGTRVYNNAPEKMGNYDFDTDFGAMMQEAMARGDYGSAALFERLRNQKLGYMDSPYQGTNMFNYANPYVGQLERMQRDIANRDAFSYDYRDDEQYKAIRNLKKKKAQKAYDDGYGAMSKQFEGGVPVAMINKLMSTKADIEDQADSYIPQLKQMAYQMYMNEGDQMMRNYAMMQDAANQDYNRWADERDMLISGMENAYNRAWDEKKYSDSKDQWQQQFDYEKERDKVGDSQWQQQFDYRKERDKVGDSQWQQQFDYGKQRDGILDDQWLKYYELDKYKAYK